LTVLWNGGERPRCTWSFGLALAMLLRNQWLKLRGVYRVLLIVPWAVPNYITALIWKGMFHSQFGAINGLLSFCGVQPVSWFSPFQDGLRGERHHQHVAGLSVHDGRLPRRAAGHSARPGGSGGDGRRGRLDAVPAGDFAADQNRRWCRRVILGSVWTINMFNIHLPRLGRRAGRATEILISEAYRWALHAAGTVRLRGGPTRR
jgi:arabinogalactan oligomer/maltooligosaccharide transport system permease protein